MAFPPSRATSLRVDCKDAPTNDGANIEKYWEADWDLAAQPALDFDVDQRINLQRGKKAIRCGACVADSRPFAERGHRQSCGSVAQTAG